MAPSELTEAERLARRAFYVPNYDKCPLCDETPAEMHKHLHVAHNWASPGSVFGRIVYGINGSMCCDGCGFKAAKTMANGPIEYLPRCWVCGLTFTNAEI